MEYCYSGTESLWYRNWNCHVCPKRKCTADRSIGVNPSRKQGCYSLSCLWFQAQQDTSDTDISQNLDYWLTIRHRCIYMRSLNEMLFLSSKSKDCMNSAVTVLTQIVQPWSCLECLTTMCDLMLFDPWSWKAIGVVLFQFPHHISYILFINMYT